MVQKCTIERWMHSEFGLSGNKLYAYALVYTNPGENMTSSDVGDFFGWSKRNALKELQYLLDEGFIKTEKVEVYEKVRRQMVTYVYYHPVYIGDVRKKLAKRGKTDG